VKREDAIALSKSGFWKEMTLEAIVRFQLFEDLLCMPFNVFHEAVEKVLGRSVWTHEFAEPDRLRSELRQVAQGSRSLDNRCGGQPPNGSGNGPRHRNVL
jgi:hypothetical protein